MDKQNELEYLLAEIDNIKNTAEKAVLNGEKTLKDTMAVYESIESKLFCR